MGAVAEAQSMQELREKCFPQSPARIAGIRLFHPLGTVSSLFCYVPTAVDTCTRAKYIEINALMILSRPAALEHLLTRSIDFAIISGQLLLHSLLISLAINSRGIDSLCKRN